MSQTLTYEDFQTKELEYSLENQLALSNPDVQELIQTPLPKYDIGIDRINTERRDDLDTNFGKYWQRQVIMSDGQRHTEILGLSNQPNANELVVSVPAWWTRLDGGINKVTSDALHQHGLHTLIKGVSENQPSTLSRGAHDLHTVLDYDTQDGLSYYFNPDAIYVQGDSNGAMQGTGIIDYAEEHSRKIIDAFLVDPCIVHKINLQDIKKSIEHPSYVPKELISLARQIGRYFINPTIDVQECAKTIESNPSRVLGNLMLSKALFSGEYGLLLAHLPKNQREHFVLFKHSLANHKQYALKILGSIGTQATVTLRTGTHISIANPRIITEKVNYLTKGILPDNE